MSVWFSWFSICFFGLAMLMGVFNLLDRRAEMILNEQGIFNRQTYGIFNDKKNKGFVTWESIKDAFLIAYQNRSPQGIPTSKQKFICLNLDREAINNLGDRSNKLSKKLGLGDYNIPLANLKNFDEQKFIELVKTMSICDFSQKQQLLNEFKKQL